LIFIVSLTPGNGLKPGFANISTIMPSALSSGPKKHTAQAICLRPISLSTCEQKVTDDVQHFSLQAHGDVHA
jgi:hypothetical protein